MLETPMLAAPVAERLPANAEVATSDPADALRPIFVNLFLLITPF